MGQDGKQDGQQDGKQDGKTLTLVAAFGLRGKGPLRVEQLVPQQPPRPRRHRDVPLQFRGDLPTKHHRDARDVFQAGTRWGVGVAIEGC